MKRSVLGIPVLVGILFLVNCGGGGGGSSAAPESTPVNLSQIKQFEEASAAPGTSMTFQMTGTASNGVNAVGLTATATVTVMLPAMVDGQSCNVEQQVISMTNTTTGQSSSSTATVYVLPTGNVLKAITGQGVTARPLSQALLPLTALVGDTGEYRTVYYSDGRTETSTWRIELGTDGKAVIKFSQSFRDNLGNPVATEEDSYTLGSDGAITAFTMKAMDVATGITIILSGNRL